MMGGEDECGEEEADSQDEVGGLEVVGAPRGGGAAADEQTERRGAVLGSTGVGGRALFSARLSRQSRQTKNAVFARQELQKPPQSAQGTRFLFVGYPHLLSVKCVRFL